MNLKKVSSTQAIVMALMVVATFVSCAKSPYINVDYRPPDGHPVMIPAETVAIEAVDLREDTPIFNDEAKNTFKNFSGEFSLLMRESESQQTSLGHHTLPQLFETAFAQRLQRLGVDVIDRPSPETLRFQIGISQFRIGLDGNTWRTDISYKASLLEDGKTVTSETVTGSAKRPKIAGRGGAEKAISEIFTDVINQLDIERLFAEAEE